MKPSDGLFSLCTGPAKKGMTPLLPGSILPIYNETNAFYEIKLEDSPESVVVYAKEKAEEFIKNAELMLGQVNLNESLIKLLFSYLYDAKQNYAHGINNGKELYNIAKALRSFTRAQVKARQVVNTINLPPSSPDEL